MKPKENSLKIDDKFLRKLHKDMARFIKVVEKAHKQAAISKLIFKEIT